MSVTLIRHGQHVKYHLFRPTVGGFVADLTGRPAVIWFEAGDKKVEQHLNCNKAQRPR
ncbi:hypothetical protein [Brevundimonas nasdae]|uniref:hypothetical protein n=1 Tax=Brevundimonas nasdae TaxID=172043 RepID=UPI00289B5D57|nr:hypothetical protein [Brevundimonas nasdae]